MRYARYKRLNDPHEFAQRVCEHALRYAPHVILYPDALAYRIMRHVLAEFVRRDEARGNAAELGLVVYVRPRFDALRELHEAGIAYARRARDDLDKQIVRMLKDPDGLFTFIGNDKKITRAGIAAYLCVSRYVLSRRMDALAQTMKGTNHGEVKR